MEDMAGAEALKRQGSAAETGIREQPDGCFLFCISAFKSSSKHAIATPNLSSSSPPQCRIPGFDPKSGRFPWKWEWQPAPVLLPREFHGQTMGRKRVGHD